jgi:carbonic anhydrase/acetyltransferase-like protein (isoleucine patch superfamily)
VLVGPLAVLVGCTLEDAVYVATGVMIFQGVRLGRGSRLGAGSIAHVGDRLPRGVRLGMRQYAIAREDEDALLTGDLEEARAALAKSDFFGHVFAEHSETSNRCIAPRWARSEQRRSSGPP